MLNKGTDIGDIRINSKFLKKYRRMYICVCVYVL